MEGFLQNFQDLKIEKEEIEKATNNFDDQNNYIGGGGFGKVYKGEVSHSKGRSMAAVKRLDRSNGQGDAEFLKEIDILTRYKHENLISLLGFCYQGDEAFIVYELASRGSLDRHLDSPDLTWSKRIKICHDAAKGLYYIHNPWGGHQRVIHCDVKAGNILLDDQWKAKIADFGFSIMGLTNNGQSTVVTLAAGTLGYIDPVYRMTNMLTKESDVYSFGVVLFEVLLGRLCYTINSNGDVDQILVHKWKKYYEENKLNDIVFKDPAIQPLEQSVLQIFSDIAYQCLNESRKDRPMMAVVVKELYTAFRLQELLETQELSDWNEQGVSYKEVIKSADPPLNYRSEDELKMLLFRGVLLNEGKTWFSLNKKGEHCEIIPIAECLVSADQVYYVHVEALKSRFFSTYISCSGKFKTHVKTHFLSLGINYAVSLLFKFGNVRESGKCVNISLKYKLQGERKTSISRLAYEREDGWWMVELYQFTCDQRSVDLQILFKGSNTSNFVDLRVEGIEFRSLEKVEHIEDENQPISDSDADADWEENLPIDYEDIMKRSKNSLQWETKKEAYALMREGFLINDVDKESSIWFCLDKNGKKCHMLSATKVLRQTWWRVPLPLDQSRFGEALQHDHWKLYLEYEVQPQLVSSQTTNAIYLVYKLSEDQSGFEVPMRMYNKEYHHEGYWSSSCICLVDPQTPVIKPKADQNTHNPASKLIKESRPQQRNDGWMEVRLWEIQSVTTIKNPIRLRLRSFVSKTCRGLIIEGVEFRPL